MFSGEKNHTNCCLERNVETECLPLCSGQVSTFQSSLENIHCLQRMPEVASCMQENKGKISRTLPASILPATVSSVHWNISMVRYLLSLNMVCSYLGVLPTSPRSLYVLDVTSRSATVTWQNPDSDVEVLYYLVEYVPWVGEDYSYLRVSVIFLLGPWMTAVCNRYLTKDDKTSNLNDLDIFPRIVPLPVRIFIK